MSEGQPYPLNHGLGYMPFPRDAARYGPLIKDGNAFRMYVLLYSRAGHTARWERGSHGDVYLQEGQCILGVREAGCELGLSKNASHRALKKLEKLGLISRKAGQLGSVVTMLFYGVYGDSWRDDGTATGTASGTAAGTAAGTKTGQPRTPKERGNGKNGKNGGAAIPESALQLADRLRAHVLDRQPDHRDLSARKWEATRARWADSFRLAHERDGRDWEDMGRVLDWSQQETFWQSNILSGSKFRDKFDTLKGQMARSQPETPKRVALGDILGGAR